jgi:hypothetical protein
MLAEPGPNVVVADGGGYGGGYGRGPASEALYCGASFMQCLITSAVIIVIIIVIVIILAAVR